MYAGTGRRAARYWAARRELVREQDAQGDLTAISSRYPNNRSRVAIKERGERRGENQRRSLTQQPKGCVWT